MRGRYGGGGRYDDDRRGGGGGGGGGYRDDPWRRDRGDRDDRGPPRGGGFDDSGPRERPKLNLKPRSAPVNGEKKEGAGGGGASIFGDARPVDTASRELEIEKKLHTKDSQPKRSTCNKGQVMLAIYRESGGGGAGGGIFGDAKPVDTASREKEIEEKLLRESQTALSRSVHAFNGK
ncbi:hypothetical protein SK128_018086 [Halocaridina rubra]|uniref:Uncharacterized protein n=1 Tax=Halocaridina rubra TaxID=373956 RepID=A0AAN8WY63_HALRR